MARVEVDFRVLPLLHKELRLTKVLVTAPRVFLESDPEGLNLSRALAPRHKVPAKTAPKPKPTSAGEGWVVRLERLDLRNGAVLVTSSDGTNREKLVHLEDLTSSMKLRYATGNGSAELALRLSGRSALAPEGPLALEAEARVRGTETHFSFHGRVLGGTVQARGDVDTQHLAAADALAAISIPRTELRGYGWGPLRLHAQTSPGAVPRLNLSLAIPGLQLTAQGGGDGTDVFKLDSRIAVDDLARTAKAVRAVTMKALPAMAGHGDLRLTLEGALAGAPASLNAAWQGRFDDLRFGNDTLTHLSIDGHAAQLATIPGDVALSVSARSATLGTTRLGKPALDLEVHQQAISLSARMASPQPVHLALAGHLDADRHGLRLSRFLLAYPRAKWTSEGTAQLRFEGEKLSLSGLRLRSQGQRVALDAAKDDGRIDAHVALTKFRLDSLPSAVMPRDLDLGGVVDLDVKADGELDDPKAVARLRLQEGHFRSFSNLGASIDATLADQRVDGTLTVHAPLTDVNGAYHLPVAPLSGGAVNLRLAVERLDLAEAFQRMQTKPGLRGRITAGLRVTGTARDPRVALAVDGRDLRIKGAPGAVEGSNPSRWAEPPSISPTEIALRTPISISARHMAASCAPTSLPGSTWPIRRSPRGSP